MAGDSPRGAWLDERRRAVSRRYDTLHAPRYDEGHGELGELHRRFVSQLVEACPPRGTILDAACGTGKYWPLVLSAGRLVLGADQSRGMLRAARRKNPAVPVVQVRLTDLAFHRPFPAAMCIDALECLPPDEWSIAFRRLAAAVREGGTVYVTVERTTQEELERAFQDARAQGVPAIPGEDVRGGGYHY